MDKVIRKLESERERREESVEEFSVALEVSSATYRRWLNGRPMSRFIRRTELARIERREGLRESGGKEKRP